MAKETSWNSISRLTWTATILLFLVNFKYLIPNKTISLSISIIVIVIAVGANMAGLYRLKKKKY